VVSTLQAFDLRMQQTGSHPFRGLAGPSVHLSLDDAREHERHEAARQADYEQVMNAHGRSIANIARRYAKDPAEREDLEQEIALAIWRALPRFRGESSVRTYVLRIAHNTGCGFRKKRRLAPSAAEVVDTSGCPELGAQRRERSRRLTGAMAELPAKLRDVISLRLRGHSYAEISDELSITETNVSVRLTRARRFLRDRLLATG
jgi:RNA polymerase sigma-70 factor (ECF subfamily)